MKTLSKPALGWTLGWALVGAAVAAWLARVPLEGVPHVQDEVVYLLQAKALAAGGLGWLPQQPLALETFHFLLDLDGQRFGVFPPGWPAVLALGVLAGASWLVNPVLHAVTVAVGAALAGRVGGVGAARLAAPLLALSPGLLVLAGSRMSHTWTALVVLCGVGLSLRSGARAAAGVGVCLGLLVLSRPLDAVVLWLVVLPGLARQGPRVLLGAGAGPLVGLALLGAVNAAVTGDPGVLPQTAYFAEGLPPITAAAFRYAPGCNALGFSDAVGCFPTQGDLGHTPAKAWTTGVRNLGAAGRLWLGTPVILLLALGAARVPRARGLARRGAALWCLLAGGYALYWAPGLAYGARFHHSAAPVVVILVAVGATVVMNRLPRLPWPAVLLALLAAPALRLSATLPELEGYWGVDGRFVDLAERWTGAPAVWLIAYGGGGAVTLDAPQSLGTTLTAAAHLWRGSWVGRDTDRVALVEFQPGLIDAALAAWPGRQGWLYVMHADRTRDQLIPLGKLGRGAQVPTLALPVDPFLASPFPVDPLPQTGPLP